MKALGLFTQQLHYTILQEPAITNLKKKNLNKKKQLAQCTRPRLPHNSLLQKKKNILIHSKSKFFSSPYLMS